MFETEVNYLLKTPDNIEIIRDQICGILAIECENQFDLATQAGDSVADDYNIKVFVEHTEPWAILSEDDKDSFPLVNVCLQDVVNERGSDDKSLFSCKANFNIDCYNSGVFNGDGLNGRGAVIKCWKTARIIRNILAAANYTYLGLRGVVRNRQIVSIESGVPNSSDGSINVCVCRIRMAVDFIERSPQVEGPIMEPISISITDDNGVIVMK